MKTSGVRYFHAVAVYFDLDATRVSVIPVGDCIVYRFRDNGVRNLAYLVCSRSFVVVAGPLVDVVVYVRNGLVLSLGCRREQSEPAVATRFSSMFESCGRFEPLPAEGVPAKHGDDGDKKAEREVDGQRERDGFGIAGSKQIP